VISKEQAAASVGTVGTTVAGLAGKGFVGLTAGEPVDLDLPAGTTTVPLRLALAGPAPVADPAGGSRLGVDLGVVWLTVSPLDHEVTVPVPRATGKELTTDLDTEREVRRVRVLDLELPRDGGTLYRFDEGGVRVETPRAAEDPESPEYTDVIGVLSVGPRGTDGLPTRGFPGFGPPDAARLYGDQLPSGTTRGTPSRLELDLGSGGGAVRAGRVSLRFCTEDGPLELDPVTFTAAAEVVHAAQPSGLRLEVGPASAPVLAWQHDPPLDATDTAELVPVLASLFSAAVAEAAAPATEVVLDARLTATGPARVRLVLFTDDDTDTGARTRTRHDKDPARIPLAGTGATLAAGPPGDPVPAAVTARLTGSAGPVRRTAASPSPLADPPRRGVVVTDTRHVACHVTAAALEGRPLVRVGVLAAGVAGELVVELRADAGGPGPVLAPGGVATFGTHAVPTWLTVDVPPLPVDAVPPAGCWVVVRANAGRLLWAEAGPEGLPAPSRAMASDDAGRTWQPVPGGSPGPALFVDDPGGAVPPLMMRAGDVVAPLLPAPGAAFDAVVDWPDALRHAMPGTDAVRLDCARDLQLEVAGLRLAWPAGLILGRQP
jgi:hypothetical protein